DKYIAGQVEGFNPTTFGRLLYGRQEFENDSQKFSAEGDTRMALGAAGARTIARNFTVDDAMVAEFRQQLIDNHLKIDEAAFTKDLDFIKAMIRFRIDEALFGVADARRHLISADPQAQLALTMFGEAQRLVALSKGTTKAH